MSFPKLGLLPFWMPTTLFVDLRLKWGLKEIFSPHYELSNDMLQATCTQENRGELWLLMVESQIANLTLNFSFGHNLCFKNPNGSCEPTLDIYVQDISDDIMNFSFQWLLTPAIILEKFRSPLGVQLPKWVHLGVWGSFLHIFPHFWEHEMWLLASLLARTFVSPSLGCEPKFKVMTLDPSFDHNLCFKYPNGSCEPILNIYILRGFHWYDELFNLMNFDPCNRLLKIRESIGSPIPKVGAHLGVCQFIPSHSSTLLGAWNVTPGLHSWPAHLQAFAFVASPRLGLWYFFS
jgi:hypothetical protein